MAAPTPIYLVTKADFAPYVDVAGNLSDLKLNPRILEAQRFDLMPLLGEKFFTSIYVDNPQTDILDLIQGVSYIVDGITYTYEGLKPVIVYFAAARLVKTLDIHITPNGMMQKRNEYSDHLDTKAIAMKVTEYQNLALAYWQEADKFINAKGDNIYPDYINFSQCGNNSGGYRPRIFGISGKGTDTNYYGCR